MEFNKEERELFLQELVLMRKALEELVEELKTRRTLN